MKAYLYTIFFLLLDAVYTLIVLAVSVSRVKGRGDWPFLVTCVLTGMMLIAGLLLAGIGQWWHLAFRNEVWLEYREPRKPISLGFKDARDASYPLLRFAQFSANPWVRGTLENLHQVLGSSWWMVSPQLSCMAYSFS